MTSPYALVLSIAGTVGMFIIALVGIIADASLAPTPAAGDALAARLVAAVAEDVRPADAVADTVAWEPAASRR